MGLHSIRSRGRSVRAACGVAATAALMAVLPVPAQAQFWGDWGRPQPQQRYQQQQQYNPFGDWFRTTPSRPQVRPQREAPADNSHAPATRKADMKDESKVTNKIVVMGDGMADWLAYGLEDAFSEQPEVGIVRKHRTTSGLIHYDGRKDIDWAHVAKEIIAAEKPNFIVMMVGVNDRQSIHQPAPAARAASKKGGAAQQAAPAPTAEKLDPEALARQSAEQQNAAIEAKEEEAAAAKAEREREKERAAHPSGTFEFHSEQWEAAYIKRIDATVAAMKSAGVPVLWVGLPSQRNSKVSSDAGYLNDLYRQRAEKAGVIYVDIWDGFVDESGRYTTQGPDYEGQIRRLRSADGVYFTKAGARKLAHYVEREIQRSLANRAVPVALPVGPAVPAAGGRPGSPRPVAGPVVPLTVSTGGGNELLGGGRAQRQPASDPVATRVLIKGEPIAAAAGRADDFTWPRGSDAAPVAEPAPAAAAPASTPARAAPAAPSRSSKAATANQNANAQETEPAAPPVRKRPRRSSQSAPRPPLAINPSTWFR